MDSFVRSLSCLSENRYIGLTKINEHLKEGNELIVRNAIRTELAHFRFCVGVIIAANDIGFQISKSYVEDIGGI